MERFHETTGHGPGSEAEYRALQLAGGGRALDAVMRAAADAGFGPCRLTVRRPLARKGWLAVATVAGEHGTIEILGSELATINWPDWHSCLVEPPRDPGSPR